MKLVTYSPRSAQSPETRIGAVVDSSVVDLNYVYACLLYEVEGEARAYELAWARIPPDMIGFIQGGRKALLEAQRSLEFARDRMKRNDLGLSGEQLGYPLEDVKVHAPIRRPGKILAAGKNYAEHVKERVAKGAPVELPPFPRGFVKVSSVII